MCCHNFNPNGLINYEKLLIESYDKLMTWLFDEAIIYQKEDKISRKIVSISRKLPLNL